MKYFLRKLYIKDIGKIQEEILLTSRNEQYKVINNEELISSKEITKEKAIEFCGKEAIE